MLSIQSFVYDIADKCHKPHIVFVTQQLPTSSDVQKMTAPNGCASILYAARSGEHQFIVAQVLEHDFSM